MKEHRKRATRAAWRVMERPSGGIVINAQNARPSFGGAVVAHNRGTMIFQTAVQQNVVINLGLKIAVEELLKIVQDPDNPSNAKATWIEFAQNQLNKV